MIAIDLLDDGSNVSLLLPTAWRELSGEEIFSVAGCLLKHGSNPNLEYLLLDLLIRSRARDAGIKPDVINRIDLEDAYLYCLPHLKFIIDSLPDIDLPDISSRYISQIFEKITVGEYEEVLQYLDPLTEVGEHMATICAILYRRRGVPFMHFRPYKNDYDTYDYHAREKDFKKIPAEKLYTVILYLVGWCGRLKEIFDLVFSGESGAADKLAFTKCIHSAAGPKNGNRQQIRATPLFEFLFEMQQEAVKAEELKKKYNT